jgi:large subunit ribosomal protein L25
MISQELVEATPRAEVANKNDNRRLRRAGKIPAVVYGAGKDPIALVVEPKQITRILHSKAGHNTIFDLKVGADVAKAMIVDWQYEPIKGSVMHIDLKRIAMDKPMRVNVPVQLMGVPEGVKTQGGILDLVQREVEIECLPADIPTQIEVDVTGLIFGQVLRVSDLPSGGKLKFITSGEQTVAHITAVKEEVVATPEATAAAPTATEPEVLKKGKTEEEGAAAPAAPAAKAKK